MTAFTVTYAAERAQYCVERGDMRIWPTRMPASDPDAALRAVELADALNRMEDVRALEVRKPFGIVPEPTQEMRADACADIPPDYCAVCDLAVYAVYVAYHFVCPECGAQVAEGEAI